jgi:xylulokinase
MIDRSMQLLRPSIIWCDSRAVETGNEAFESTGKERCLSHLLNSPGNFTASKLAWVRRNEPRIYEKAWKIMLPGDYIAMRMTGEVNTTVSGLSEGIFWDFRDKSLAGFLIDYFGFDRSVIPDVVPTFSVQGHLKTDAADELGLPAGTPVSYRAGDQPNNAFSLNVLNPGEIAATAGTSGVVYGISEEIRYDPLSRVNTFAHVNHTADQNRLGVLLCINGTGILYSWARNLISGGSINYPGLNKSAEMAPVGSEGISVLPFGNGAERMLGNMETGCHIHNLNFNIHNDSHIIRAIQEGIVFAFYYGIGIMKNTGIIPGIIRAGNTNMFLSKVFRETLSGLSGSVIELYDTDGSQGAAKGAGMGIRFYKDSSEAFSVLRRSDFIEPDTKISEAYKEAYQKWLNYLNLIIHK